MNASLTPATAKSAHPTLRAVAFPILLESMMALLVGVIGTYLASKISDATAAAYGVTNHLWGMMFVLFRVVGAGVGVVVAHRLGAKQFAAADEVARVALGGATWLGGAIGVAAIVGADTLLALMAAPPEVSATAGPLLRITGFLFLLEAWCVSFAGVLRVHLHVRSVLTAIALMHSIHLALGIALVPRFGIVGYTYAMLASRIVIVVLYLCVIFGSLMFLSSCHSCALASPRQSSIWAGCWRFWSVCA
jgi:Na+-driven multidrug efflux pump